MGTNQLTDAIGRPLIEFMVDDIEFFVRQPMPEEYDDAETLKDMVYQKTKLDPNVKELIDTPCSDNERDMFERLIAENQKRFDELGDGNTKLKDHLAAEIARLRNLIETRTLADEYAWDKAILARDRWLTMRLLCDAKGRQIFNPKSKAFEAQWARFSVKIKDAARIPIWQALELVREAPFSSMD